MGLLNKLFNKKKDNYPLIYEEKDIEALESFISNSFGKFSSVFHEIVSPDIHVDIAIIEPNDQQDYYTLITMGMGAYKMNAPKELSKYKLDFAEIMVRLPKEWIVNNNEEKWYWPLRWLKILARFPLEQDTWLGDGHTIPNGEPFSEDTLLNCILLLSAVDKDCNEAIVKLPSGKVINFYTMVPLYEEEVKYKIENGVEALLDKFEQEDIPFPPIIDKNRKNVCK